MSLELDLDFETVFRSDDFLFGVANAPYLSEGGYNRPDGIKNSYAVLELRGHMEPSGEATRFWSDYERQIGLAADLGLNAFRFGVDWSRVQPSTSLERTDPPAWDDRAVEGYARITAAIIRRGMVPIMTLHHFTHPAWEGLDFWQRDDGPDRLVAFQLRVVAEINDQLVAAGLGPVGHYIVYNEANDVPLIYHSSSMFPGTAKGETAVATAFDHLLSRYVVIYDRIKDLYAERGWAEPEIGFGVSSKGQYELDRFLYDIVRVRHHGVARADVAAHIAACREAWMARVAPLARSKLTDPQLAAWSALVEEARADLPVMRLTRTLDAIYASPRPRKLDYLSCNIYEPFGSAKKADPPGRRVEFWDWAADTEVYATYIRATSDGNDDLPVYMGENSLIYRRPRGGAAEPRPDGWTRERYLKSYLMEMVKGIKDGVPIRGYLYWTIVDDFEWEHGFTPRCGLYSYDFDTHEIGETDGLGEPAGPIYGALVGALRSGDKARIATTFTSRFVRTT
jgi:beta-glucosidase